jgi:peptidoglycan hydrolase CwlO-like protein
LPQEDFELVRQALESRMHTLCSNISQQEGVIQALQAEEASAQVAKAEFKVGAKRGAQEAKAGCKVLPKEVPRRLRLGARCCQKRCPGG